MAQDLKKFVNPKFLKTVDLRLLRRLFERQPSDPARTEPSLFDGDDQAARRALMELFAGPEDALPEGLVADLHRIAELGTEQGMTLLQSYAERRGIELAPAEYDDADGAPLDPKHFALLAFLDNSSIFDAASDLMALEARAALAEYVGMAEDVEPSLTDATKAAFEDAARAVFRRDYRSAYCRVGWYEDDGEVNIVITHGATVTVLPVIEKDEERVISYRGAEHAVLAYVPATGRLKVGGLNKARRGEMVEIFARTMLDAPDFFAGEDSQDLYTLAPVEAAGLGFVVERAFDPTILGVQIVEVQIDRITTDLQTKDVAVMNSFVSKDSRGNALAKFADLAKSGIAFGPNTYRIGHMVLRVRLALPRGGETKVTIKIKPPSQATYRRHQFEARIMELLRRNGFCRDREPGTAAIAAE
jgi:hypothetical protein